MRPQRRYLDIETLDVNLGISFKCCARTAMDLFLGFLVTFVMILSSVSFLCEGPSNQNTKRPWPCNTFKNELTPVDQGCWSSSWTLLDEVHVWVFGAAFW